MKQLLAFLFCISTSFHSRGQITFERNDSLELGWYCCQTAEYIIQTNDSGYIAAGFIVSGTIVNYFWEKLDSTGYSQWRKMFGYSGDAYLYSMDQTNDHGLVLCGIPSDPRFSIGIIKTDSIGMLQWQKNIGIGNGDLYGYSIKHTMDGGFIVAGSKNFPGSWDAELVKLDSSGSIIWSKAYGAVLSKEIFFDIIETDDSGYVAIGSVDTPGLFNHILIVRTNSNGDTIWTKTFRDGFNFTEATSVTKTFDGGLVISGYPKGQWIPANGSVLFKLNSQGDLLWEKKWGISDSLIINSVEQTRDSGLIISGYFIQVPIKGCLIKTNSQGDTLWTRLINAGSDVCESYDGGFAIAGGGLATVIKTDPMGNTQCNSTTWDFEITTSSMILENDTIFVTTDALATPILISGFNGTPLIERMLCNSLGEQTKEYVKPVTEVFPNPCDKILKIKSNFEFSTFEIYNSIGVMVKCSNFTGKINLEIDISDLSPSIYFIKLYSKEGVATLKFLKD